MVEVVPSICLPHQHLLSTLPSTRRSSPIPIPIPDPLAHSQWGPHRRNVVNLKERVRAVRADGTRRPRWRLHGVDDAMISRGRLREASTYRRVRRTATQA